MSKIGVFVILLLTYAFSWPLDSVLTRADSCASVVWTPSVHNTDPWWFVEYGSRCTGSDSVYRRCDFLPDVRYTGVAYSYGGEDSDVLFAEKLADDYLVGSHSCHYYSYGDPSDTIAGADCSGFLSYAWNCPRYSTSGFLSSSRFEQIGVAQVRSGDALVKAASGCGYHAVLVMERTGDDALIAEASSSVFGVRFRTTDLSHSYWDCYTGLRYPEIDRQVFTDAPEVAKDITSFNLIRDESGSHTLFARKDCRYRLYLPNGAIIERGFLRAGNTKRITTKTNAVYICEIRTAKRSETFRLIGF